MTSDAASERPPAVRASDADRDAAVARLQKALAEGRIDPGEFAERAAAAAAAVTTAELAPLLADLPADPPPDEVVGTRTPERVTSVVGDVRLQGRTGAPRQVLSAFGDVRLDLRGLRTDADRVELVVGTLIGDVDVVVDEGVDAVLEGWTVIGSRRTRLAPMPRAPGTPQVVVRAHSAFGDVRLRSLAPGEPVSRWSSVVDRLRGRRPPSPPSAR